MTRPIRSYHPDEGAEPGRDDPSAPLRWDRSREPELAVRIRLGEVDAFEELFHAYYEPLCAFVLGYVGSTETAEDVVQEMFTRLWDRRAEWEVRGSVRSYLYGAARNRALTHLRHTRVVARWQERAVREAETRSGAAAPADERVRADELAQAIARAVEQLPPRRRQAYTLRWQHDLPLAEIAAIMGVTVKCVELQLTSASKAVREALAEFF